MCVFSVTSHSCSKAGRTMDAVSASCRFPNVKSKKNLRKEAWIRLCKHKVWNTPRGLWTFWLHWEVGSWKAESRFLCIFSVCPDFLRGDSGNVLVRSYLYQICFTKLEVRPTLEHVGRRRRGELSGAAYRLKFLSRALSTQRCRRTLCLHESAQGNGRSLKLTPNTASPNAMNVHVSHRDLQCAQAAKQNFVSFVKAPEVTVNYTDWHRKWYHGSTWTDMDTQEQKGYVNVEKDQKTSTAELPR